MLTHVPTFRRQQKKSAYAKKIVRLCSHEKHAFTYKTSMNYVEKNIL